MATSSYSTLFGTTGAGKQGSRAGIGTLFGQQAAPEDETEQQKQQRLQPTQTFAQLQKQGVARPAPQAPQGQPFTRFEGSQQAGQARTGMLGALQQQLAQPTRFDTQAFQQIRQAQQANLQSQFEEQQRQLNEDLARRGLSASTIGAAGLGRLAGAQSRALADIDAQLLQQAAQTQAADRLAALQAAQGFAELAGAQDLAQFEANRVAQAAEFQQGLQGAQFGQQQAEFERGQALAAAQAQQAQQESAMERGLREALGVGEIIRGERQQELQAAELTGRLGERETLSAKQQAEQRRQFDIQQALQGQLGLGGLEVQRGELGLRREQLAQQAAEATGRVQVGTRIVYNDAGVPIGEEPIFESTVQQQQLEQQRRMQEAELTGEFTRPDGTKVSTLVAQQLGQARASQLADQAARQSQLTGVMYKVDSKGNIVQERGPDNQPISTEARRAQMQQEEQARLERQLRETLGMGELTGTVTRDGQVVTTLPAQTARQNLLVQLAGALAGSEQGIPANFLQQLYAALGVYNPGNDLNNQDTGVDRELERRRYQTPAPTTTTTTPRTTTVTTPTGPQRRGG